MKRSLLFLFLFLFLFGFGSLSLTSSCVSPLVGGVI